ncbi:hypothetical protein V6N11_037840 [Hibiscus sabdariffa]|uniref:Uncharacterized protein n=1 Tax=Hibiscus sabdariffa TaxID=183260 RepID=A0ABR2A5P9_9ROSI
MLNLPNAPTNPVDATVPMGAVIETPLTDATAPLGNIPAMETKLAATTISPAPNVASANTPHVAGGMPNKVVVADSTNAPTTPVDANINVPMVVFFEPQSIVPFGSTMVPTTTSFGGKGDFIDFLANPIETTNVVPYLLDNVGLDAISTTILPIPREGGLENDMGKSFLATSFMLIVFDDWLSKTSSLTASMINNEIPTLIGRGSKRCSSMQDDNMLKKPRRPPPPQFFQRLELG